MPGARWSAACRGRRPVRGNGSARWSSPLESDVSNRLPPIQTLQRIDPGAGANSIRATSSNGCAACGGLGATESTSMRTSPIAPCADDGSVVAAANTTAVNAASQLIMPFRIRSDSRRRQSPGPSIGDAIRAKQNGQVSEPRKSASHASVVGGRVAAEDDQEASLGTFTPQFPSRREAVPSGLEQHGPTCRAPDAPRREAHRSRKRLDGAAPESNRPSVGYTPHRF